MRAAAADLGADVVFPTSSSEILHWAQARDDFGLPVLAGPADGVEAASDKAETFRVAERAGVPHPRTIEVDDPDAFAAAVHELGYPQRRVVDEAHAGQGLARVPHPRPDGRPPPLAARVASRRGRRPNGSRTCSHLLGEGPFPAYIVQEYLDGPEETVDAICLGGELLLPMTRTREALRAGLAMDFTLLERPREEADSARLAEVLAMDYFLSVQFKGGKLMEINPRVSTIVYTPEINPPALAVGLALGRRMPRSCAGCARRCRSAGARSAISTRSSSPERATGRARRGQAGRIARSCAHPHHVSRRPSSPTSAG